MRSLCPSAYGVVVKDFHTRASGEIPEDIRTSPLLSEELERIPAFPNVTEAERWADGLAVSLGIPKRAMSERTKEPPSRALSYYADNYSLKVTISYRGVLEGKPAWRLSGAIARRDVGLSVELPIRVRPEAFRRDAETLTRRLRSLQVYPESRVRGRISKWKRNEGYGYLECFPGAPVYVAKDELESRCLTPTNSKNGFLFKIQQTPRGQRAVDLISGDTLR